MRWRNLADLAGEEFEAAAMKSAAERDRDVAGAIPAHLEHRRLVAGEGERCRQTARTPAGMDDEIAIVAGPIRWSKIYPQRPSEVGARRLDVDERHLDPRNSAAQPGDQRADHAGSDDGDFVGDPRGGVPDRVERGLH